MTKFPLLAALEVVILTASSAVVHQNDNITVSVKLASWPFSFFTVTSVNSATHRLTLSHATGQYHWWPRLWATIRPASSQQQDNLHPTGCLLDTMISIIVHTARPIKPLCCTRRLFLQSLAWCTVTICVHTCRRSQRWHSVVRFNIKTVFLCVKGIPL